MRPELLFGFVLDHLVSKIEKSSYLIYLRTVFKNFSIEKTEKLIKIEPLAKIKI